MTSHHSNIVILGGGIAGLTAGYYAKKAGFKTTILEAHDKPGGVINSQRKDGFLLEMGPNTVQSTPELVELIKNLNIDTQCLQSPNKIPRYIVWNKKLQRVPMSPPEFIRTSLLGPLAKGRALFEGFIPRSSSHSDESVFDFFKRRLGHQVAERLISPFVSGIWAGDAHLLSAQSAFPKLVEWEQHHGSIFAGLRTQSKISKKLISFREGLATLPKAMAQFLKPEIKFQELVTDIKPGWIVKTNKTQYKADNVILTCPTPVLGQLFTELNPDLSESLNSVQYVPLIVLHFSLDDKNLSTRPNGFGFLVAPKEKRHILGCLWNSSIFPSHSPQNKSLFTVFMGGATASNKIQLSDEELINQAISDLKSLMKMKEDPTCLSIYRYQSAIPQYTRGYQNIVSQLKECENKFTGLHFAGNFLGGISVGDVIKTTKNCVDSLRAQPKTQ